jgi:hypothetical protein
MKVLLAMQLGTRLTNLTGMNFRRYILGSMPTTGIAGGWRRLHFGSLEQILCEIKAFCEDLSNNTHASNKNRLENS